jgi:hypothetical protein
MSDNGELLDASELALLLGYGVETVKRYSTQWPDRLPPRISWSKKPMWARAVVNAWIAARNGSELLLPTPKVAAPPVERPPRVVRAGRPRRVDL